MKLLITTIAAVLLVGCGESQQSVPAPETPTAEPVAEVPTLPSSSPPEAELAWLLDNSVQAGNIQVVKHNIAIGADVKAKDESGSTPLHSAAISGHKEIAELLITKDADVNAKNEDGETPLDWAINFKQTEVADLLRKHGGKTEIELAPKTSIWNAVAANNIEFIKELIISGEDVNAKVNDKGWTPLHATGMFGYKECAEFLIAKGADVNAKDDNGETALDWAIFAYFWEQPEVKALKKETADLLRKHGGKHGTICGAAGGGDIEAVKEFLAAGMDVNIRDKRYHKTPLGWAVEHDKTETAALLRKHGAK